MGIKQDVNLLYEIGCLRHLTRTWKQFNNPGVANIAEHIFRVMWTALTLARHEKANQEKVLKIALVHDIAESRTGDVHYLSRQYVERKEDMASADMLAETLHEEEFINLLQEYEQRKTLEAKIVKDADNLDVELELQELKAKGDVLGSLWEKDRRGSVYPKLFTKTAQKFWKTIHATSPHDWHHHAVRNRFNSGDWKKKGSKK